MVGAGPRFGWADMCKGNMYHPNGVLRMTNHWIGTSGMLLVNVAYEDGTLSDTAPTPVGLHRLVALNREGEETLKQLRAAELLVKAK